MTDCLLKPTYDTATVLTAENRWARKQSKPILLQPTGSCHYPLVIHWCPQGPHSYGIRVRETKYHRNRHQILRTHEQPLPNVPKSQELRVNPPEAPETLVEYVMCLKGLMAATFESSEPLHFVKANGCVSTSLHRIYRLSVTLYLVRWRVDRNACC